MTKELVITSPIEERYVDYNGHKTYVKIVGERKDNGKKPLLVLHGGPGDCHNYLLDLARLADEHDRQVIFYDQTGCGKSMLEGMGEDFYTYDLWVNEYYTVIDALGLDDFHLFGNSWGGMLGMLVARSRRDGAAGGGVAVHIGHVVHAPWVSLWSMIASLR